MGVFFLLLRNLAYLCAVSYAAIILTQAAMDKNYATMAVLCVIGALITSNREAITGIKDK